MVRGDAADGSDHGTVHGSAVVEESAKDFLYKLGVFEIKCRRIVVLLVLLTGSVLGGGPFVGRMLVLLAETVVEPVEGTLDVAWHGYVNNSIVVVPV